MCIYIYISPLFFITLLPFSRSIIPLHCTYPQRIFYTVHAHTLREYPRCLIKVIASSQGWTEQESDLLNDMRFA